MDISDCPAPFGHSSNVWKISCVMSSTSLDWLKQKTGFPRFPCSKGTVIWAGFHQSDAFTCDEQWEKGGMQNLSACKPGNSSVGFFRGISAWVASIYSRASPVCGQYQGSICARHVEVPTSGRSGVWAVVAPAEEWNIVLAAQHPSLILKPSPSFCELSTSL